MGHSQADKAETHKRIVKIAAKRLRENGLAGVGIAELMKEAGLTVGGFYKHFDSRDALVAACFRTVPERPSVDCRFASRQKQARGKVEGDLPRNV